MGSRANIFVVNGYMEGTSRYHGVYLYKHWDGYYLALSLLYALRVASRDGRWNDTQYLTAIIFRIMDYPNDITTTSGRGISSCLGDNQYPILRVIPAGDVTKEPRIEICRQDHEHNPDEYLRRVSFSEFVAMTDAEVLRFHLGEDTGESGEGFEVAPEIVAYLAKR